MKILLIQQKMIGDVLTSSMLFETLRQTYPNAQLDYLINEHTFPVIENNPFIDNIIFFTKEAESSKKALIKLALKVRNNKYDIVIDAYSKLSSNLISLLSKAKTRISYYKPYSTLFYTHNIKRQNKGSNLAIVNRMQLLNPLEITVKPRAPKIYLTKNEISISKLFLNKHGINLNKPLFMISVLGSSLNKTYPFEYLAKVIDVVAQQTKGQLLFNYIPKQEPEAKEVFDLCEKETKEQVFFEVYGQSLREFLAITHHCEAVIGNEGGAINMAKALQVKTFAIFSPWISKTDWNLKEDENNVCLHLKDYMPDIYTKPEKTFKKNATILYQQFKPTLFINKLTKFLNEY